MDTYVDYRLVSKDLNEEYEDDNGSDLREMLPYQIEVWIGEALKWELLAGFSTLDGAVKALRKIRGA